MKPGPESAPNNPAEGPLCVCPSYLAGEDIDLDKQGSQLQVLAVIVLQRDSSETYSRDSPSVICSKANTSLLGMWAANW